MPEQEKATVTGTCERCKKIVPIVDEHSQPNLVLVGGEGWGFKKELLCTECRLQASKSSHKGLGFGQ